MNNGERRPLLLFQEPLPAKKPSGTYRPPKFKKRSREQVAGYLEPTLSRLQQALEAERIRLQLGAAGIEPEMALVIEFATEPSNFAAAARAIGLEWLAEDENEIDPSEDIFRLLLKVSRRRSPIKDAFFSPRPIVAHSTNCSVAGSNGETNRKRRGHIEKPPGETCSL